MWEAVAYALWFTLLLVFELTALVLAVVMWLLELLARAVRWTVRGLVALIRDVLRWRRAPRELAVRHYPEPRRVPPRATAALPPRELKR
jgi:hypothetical protein